MRTEELRVEWAAGEGSQLRSVMAALGRPTRIVRGKVWNCKRLGARVGRDWCAMKPCACDAFFGAARQLRGKSAASWR
eukprot:273174-Chlamydomonas_euryale.AAC.2